MTRNSARSTITVAALAAFVIAAAPVQAGGPGSCGKGKVWDSDKGACVPKPKGTGSGSHSGL